MPKPRVTLGGVADQYAAGNERIVEVSSPAGGCLIAVTTYPDRLTVDVYRADPSVVVPGQSCTCRRLTSPGDPAGPAPAGPVVPRIPRHCQAPTTWGVCNRPLTNDGACPSVADHIEPSPPGADE